MKLFKAVCNKFGMTDVLTYDQFVAAVPAPGNEKNFYDLVYKQDEIKQRGRPQLSLNMNAKQIENDEEEKTRLEFGMSPRPGQRSNYEPPKHNLSRNTLAMWLKYDTGREKEMDIYEVLTMLTDIMGAPPSERMCKKIMKE